MKQEDRHKQDKDLIKKEISTTVSKITELNTTNSIDVHINKWMNMIGTL